jgi:membrane fusion protein, multidrug efflux system
MISTTQEHEQHAAGQRLRPPVRRIAVWGPFLVVLALAIGLVFGIWRHVQQNREQEEFRKTISQVTVSFVTIHRNAKPRELILPSNIVAVEQATIYARATGYVARWLVDIGDVVQEGQVLAELATPDLDQQLAQARQQQNQAQANFEIARVTAQRWMELVEKKVVSKQEDDEKQSAYQAAAATLNAAKANVEILVALQAFKNVTAPFAGRITSRAIDVGTLVSAGSGSVGTVLYTLAKTNPLDIFVTVPQTNVPSIHAGLAVRLLAPEYLDRVFEAKVIRTAGALDPASRTLLTEVEIPNDDGALYAGMYAQVKFTLQDQTNPLTIPANTFVFKTEGSQVAMLTKGNKIHWQKIQTGRDFGTEMEVLAGLEENAQVVVNPTDDLTEGLPVQAKPADAPDQSAASPNGQPPPAEKSASGDQNAHPE